METLKTTLARIRDQNPCQEGWETLLKHLGKTKADDEPLAFATILASNGLLDAVWCIRAEPDFPARKLAVRFAMTQLHLMDDNRSVQALEVAWLHSEGLATDEELAAAQDAAWDATRAASQDAAWAAARAAAMAAAWDATWDATMSATMSATWAATWAAAQQGLSTFLEFCK